MIKKSSFFCIKTKINKNISNSCENAQKSDKEIGYIDDKVTVCREVLPTKLRYHSLEFCHFVLYNIDIENKDSAKKHSVNIPKPEAKRKNGDRY